MIVRRTPDWKMIFQLCWRFFVLYLAWSAVVTVSYRRFGADWLSISFVAVGTLGTAVAIFLAFRNNSSYDRWWEARKLWGAIVNDSRALARQTLTLLSAPEAAEARRRILYRHLAFVHGLRLTLRGQRRDYEQLADLLPAEEYESAVRSSNPPAFLLHRQSDDLAAARTAQWIDVFEHLEIHRTVDRLGDSLGGCERIKNTPLPRQYSFYTRFFVHIFNALLPLGLVSSMGWWTIPVTTLITYVFSTLDWIALRNEDPFENRPTDTPLSTIARSIEIFTREQLGESETPRPLQPVNGFLY